MPTIFVRGDLLRQEGLNALAHGCNCAGAMGKGIAVEFRARFPRMYAEYKQRCADGRFKLGEVFTWTEEGVTVFNLGTQKTWRTKAELQAIESAVTLMVQEAEARGLDKIGLPRIGAGLGGLPWESVRALLALIGERTHVNLIVFEDYVPGAVVELP
ncbi:macro domain-containing protein [Archangium minus]|uniref:Macro domain-containing protein n=1 Tax=Archangium minus TaxID=83450 RepID=A0ABY9WUI3_9BACT|nr:macro domain-containing protein [Archangium minus]